MMRKLFSLILIASIFFGISAPVFVYAANTPPASGTNVTPPTLPNTTTPGSVAGVSTANLDVVTPLLGAPVAPIAATAAGVAAVAKLFTGNGCGQISNIAVNGFTWCLIQAVTLLSMKVSSWATWISGLLLNATINYTVTNMTVHISGGVDTSGQQFDPATGINAAWKVIRDLLNLGFIFLLLWQGISMILGIGSKKEYVVGIILAALFINFSLFFTKVIIDASNVVTLGFYNSFVGQDAITDSTFKSGLANAYMNKLRISQIWDQQFLDSLNTISGNGSDQGRLYRIVLFEGFATVLLIIIAFVFLAITIMFVVRYITLIILMITSPLGYFGMAYSQAKSWSKEWWDSLIHQCLFPPAYMLMNWVVLKLLSSNFLAFPGGNTSGAWYTLFVSDITEPNRFSSSLMLVINFCIVIGLVIATLKVAKATAKGGSSMITDLTAKVGAFAGGAVLGGTAKLGRNTIGFGADRLAQNKNLKDAAAEGGAKGFAARMLLKGSNRMAESSFDARAVKMGGGLGGIVGKGAFGEMDKSNAKGYRGLMKEREEKRKKELEMLKPSDEDIVAIEKENAAREAEIKRIKQRMDDPEQQRQNEVDKKAYFESAEYKNSAEGQLEATALQELDRLKAARRNHEAQIKSQQKQLSRKHDELSAAATDDAKAAIQADIDRINKVIESEEKELATTTSSLNETNKKVSEAKKRRAEWKNEFMRKQDKEINLLLQAIATGNADKNAYQTRLDTTAKRMENMSAMEKIIDFGFDTLKGNLQPITQSQRGNIAKKIRTAAEKKKPKNQKDFIKAMKDLGYDVPEDEGGEKKDEGTNSSGGGTPAATPTP